MINQLLPARIDNDYRGQKLALWLLAVVVVVKLLQSFVVIFNGADIVRSADGVPIETFPPAAAQTVVALFALSGFSRLLLCGLCVLVWARYRGAIAFAFALLASDYLGRQLVLYFEPIVRMGTPPGPYVNFALFVLTVVGLALSLRHNPHAATRLHA